MTKRSIRIVLNEDSFRKFKVYCAISDTSMTELTNKLVDDYIKKCEKDIKIISLGN